MKRNEPPVEPRATPSATPSGEIAALRARLAALHARVQELEADAGARSGMGLQLERADAQARALFSSLLDPTIVIDASGIVQAASDSVQRVFKYAPEDLIGQNVKVLTPEPHRSAHDGYLDTYRRTGSTNILGRTREFSVVCKDGSEVACELSVGRADFPGGPCFVGSFRDVSDKKRAEENLRASEERLRALFDGTFQFMGLLAPDGALLEANRTACESIGVERESVLGQPFWATPWWSHSVEMQESIRTAVRRASAGEFVRFEVSQRTRDGVLDVDFSLMPVRGAGGRVSFLIPEGRDVSALKAAQRAETAVLRALASIGESAAVLAHEIKNPITGVSVALRAVADQLGEDHKAVLEDLVGRMRRLEQLMRGTLSFARPLELRRAPIDAQQLIEETIAHLRSQIAKAGSEVTVNRRAQRVELHGDAQRLEEVLANLISNAIEAVGTGARVELAAECADDGGATITIDDAGPGIPEEKRESIFKPFVTTKPRGTGLGLAICRKIVEAHGGSIAAQRSPAGGARFILHIPPSI
jgi:two-component system, sensor histidine kinase and response regulator